MIRFIDLRGQGTYYRFAFFDTANDKFCEFNGEHVWDTLKDLDAALSAQLSHGLMAPSYYEEIRPRLVRLMPEWAKQPPTGDEEKAFEEGDE